MTNNDNCNGFADMTIKNESERQKRFLSANRNGKKKKKKIVAVPHRIRECGDHSLYIRALLCA